MKLNEEFINGVVKSMEESDYYLSNYERYFDIQTFLMIVDKLNVKSYINNIVLDKDTYNTYYKKVVKKYDNLTHKRVKDVLKNQPTIHSLVDEDYLFDKDLVVGSFSLNKHNHFDCEYEKELVSNYLEYFLDKYNYEEGIYNTDISKEEYNKYFKDTIKRYNIKQHYKIIDKYKDFE